MLKISWKSRKNVLDKNFKKHGFTWNAYENVLVWKDLWPVTVYLYDMHNSFNPSMS